MILTLGTNRIDSRKRLLLNMACILSLSITATACSDSSSGGGTTGATTESTTGSTTDPAPIVSAAEFTDEFTVDSLSDWTLRHETENEQAQYTLLDINQIRKLNVILTTYGIILRRTWPFC